MKRLFRSCAAVVIFALLAAALWTGASASDAVSSNGGNVTDAASFVAALGGEKAAYAKDNVITLLSDVALSGTVKLAKGEYTLNGAGCFMTRAKGFGGTLISVGKGASLTLGNSRGSDDHPSLTVDGAGYDANEALLTVSGGSLTVYAGTLFTAGEGGGLCVDGGSALFYAGKITDCTAVRGGAVYVKSGEFSASMTISGCKAEEGGAIYNSGKTAMLGTVTECEAARGGAVYNSAEGDYTTDSCEYTYCKASESGGGFYTAGKLTIASGAVGIAYDDAAEGGGLYVADGAETTLYGAQITMNTALRAAGMYNVGKLTLYDGAEFTYNKASETGGGVINDGDIVMLGGSISSNDSSGSCGGIINRGSLDMSDGSISSNKSKLDTVGVDNYGYMKLSAHAFISFNNQVLLRRYTSEDGVEVRAAVDIVGELTANTPIATFRPVSGSGEDYADAYVKGEQLATLDDSGNSGVPSEEKVAVSDYNGSAYALTAEGKLVRTGFAEGAGLPLPAVIAIAAGALAVATAAVWIITSRKKKAVKK